MKRFKRGFTGCSSIQNVLNETIDSRRRIIEQTNDSVSDSESCEIPTGGKRGFTLAEVLITLAIIGVVAAISIPSVISNSQQQEFKTGLRKAVSVLNSAITMNMAIDGETPYDNANLYGYLMRHMSVMKTVTRMNNEFWVNPSETSDVLVNSAFYTTDGMRFEFRSGWQRNYHKLHESNVYLCTASTVGEFADNAVSEAGVGCKGCGSFGLKNNIDNTTKPPCLLTVDVNGDRKPNPSNINCHNSECGKDNRYKYSDPLGVKLTDLFTIMITDKQAIPYGVAAQRAMYQAQAKK